MKSINLLNVMNAAADLRNARNALKTDEWFAEKYPDTERYARDVDRSKAKVSEAEAALRTACDTIQIAISEAEGKARVRTITPIDIIVRLEQIEERLDIPKSRMKGVTVTVNDSAQKFPSAYKYTPESTYFTAEHNGKNWKLTRIWRDRCTNSVASITLSDTAKEAIVERATHL